MKFIITGCGRSGTNYLASRLNSAGVNCGHENVFTVNGPALDASCYDGDSSWFAAPYLGNFFPDACVLHVVRDPLKVIESFHKIGLCASSRHRHVTKGKGLKSVFSYCKNPIKIINRIKYVESHRRLLKSNTTVWEQDSEFLRLCEYWFQWNVLIEKKVKSNKAKYMRINLDDVDSNWQEIKDHLEIEVLPTPGEPTNKKDDYAKIKSFEHLLPSHVKSLARKYGL